jgi:hypothetical protein
MLNFSQLKTAADLSEMIQKLKQESVDNGSRELSLVITKLQEALMWLQQVKTRD